MSLFEKKREYSSSAPLYTIGVDKTVLIIGLGNPGKKYDDTRHNIGFEIINEFANNNDFPSWVSKKDLKCELSVRNLGQNRVVLCKPITFMNNSGEAAQAAQRFYRIYNQNSLVIYDELAIPFGSLRTRIGGSDAGHNGVKSLITHIGEDFARLRIGVGPKPVANAKDSDFVLGKFSKAEQGRLKDIRGEACSIVTEFIFSGQLPHETRNIF